MLKIDENCLQNENNFFYLILPIFYHLKNCWVQNADSARSLMLFYRKSIFPAVNQFRKSLSLLVRASSYLYTLRVSVQLSESYISEESDSPETNKPQCNRVTVPSHKVWYFMALFKLQRQRWDCNKILLDFTATLFLLLIQLEIIRGSDANCYANFCNVAL